MYEGVWCATLLVSSAINTRYADGTAVGDVDETCHGCHPVSTNNRNRMTTPPHVHATEKCDNSREQRHIICRQKTQGRRGTGGEEEEEEEEE